MVYFEDVVVFDVRPVGIGTVLTGFFFVGSPCVNSLNPVGVIMLLILSVKKFLIIFSAWNMCVGLTQSCKTGLMLLITVCIFSSLFIFI